MSIQQSPSSDPAVTPSKAKTWRGYAFEIVMVCLMVGAVFAFQQRNMLPSDGSVVIPDTQFVTLQSTTQGASSGTTSGTTRMLLAENKPTLVYIFAPWCSICRISINNLDSLDPDKVNVVRIGVDYQNVEALSQFVDEVGVKGDVLIGNRQTMLDFKVTAFPSIYILQPDGSVVGRSVGYTTSLGLKLRTAFE
ncbi:MAG: redoxin domain-containing protein [Glaciecola sp.]|nr:redoxin domain-containing protein [Glaciecola sp.]MDG2098111.1 redoxin domain-containing protein [Glaciecola sp.]